MSYKRISCDSDFDKERWCSWTVERTSGEFADFPVQVVRLTEHYPKRSRNRTVVTWKNVFSQLNEQLPPRLIARVLATSC
ncbi:MAG: hypothetical protein ACOCSK_01505 [Rhodothermales bacterium]